MQKTEEEVEKKCRIVFFCLNFLLWSFNSHSFSTIGRLKCSLFTVLECDASPSFNYSCRLCYRRCCLLQLHRPWTKHRRNLRKMSFFSRKINQTGILPFLVRLLLLNSLCIYSSRKGYKTAQINLSLVFRFNLYPILFTLHIIVRCLDAYNVSGCCSNK